jgi:hypothetical protein
MRKEAAVSAARAKLHELTDKLTEEDAGKVLSFALRLAEDQEDLGDARAARSEAAEKGSIPWEQVKARHGL